MLMRMPSSLEKSFCVSVGKLIVCPPLVRVNPARKWLLFNDSGSSFSPPKPEALVTELAFKIKLAVENGGEIDRSDVQNCLHFRLDETYYFSLLLHFH